ncbi:MAG: PLP-dependent aspartate aminotransferase family protein [Halobacteriales archaeon]|nr:PLP-dependent aspartate aminotransferase family protein [Halobacteriales archaeon]
MAARTPKSRFATDAVHAGDVPDARTGAVNVPVHLSSTFWYPELSGGGPSSYIYSRYSNPSVEAVETKLAALEGAAGSLLMASGMAATMTACMAILGAGAGVVVQPGVYGGTSLFFREELARFGVKATFATHPVTAPKVPKGTKLVWMEAVTNPILRVADVAAWADAAHDAGALLAVDGTFAGPMVQRSLALGADVSMQSATKYLGGHADLIAGALSWRKGFPHKDALWRVRRNWGPSLDPHAAFLLGRGMKTLHVRMPRHCENALALAKAAEGMPGIEAVHYPGLSSHPDHKVAKRVLSGGFGGAVTIDLGTKARAVAFRRKVRVIAAAASLGGVESLVSLPIETSHSYSTAAQRKAEGVGDGLARISVGIEDVADLVADVEQASR